MLLVDEAGQATPQSAVVALWRCRRAVIVGDPLQLEPITTIPFKVEQAIRKHHGVGEEWLTGRSSVQGLADCLNRLGTRLPGPEQPVWVGAPLSVHRRCDRPMFDISNEIAYDGLMVDAYDGLMVDATDPRSPRPSRRFIPRCPRASGSTFAQIPRTGTGFPTREPRSTGSSPISSASASTSRGRWRSGLFATSRASSRSAPGATED